MAGPVHQNWTLLDSWEDFVGDSTFALTIGALCHLVRHKTLQLFANPLVLSIPICIVDLDIRGMNNEHY